MVNWVSPTLSSSGVHIIEILDRQPKRKVDIELDWDDLKEMAKRDKADRKLMDRVQDARKQYHVEVRDLI